MFLTNQLLRAGAVALLGAGLSVFATPAWAGEVNTGYFGNVAIEGYDPVAYFTEGRAVKGRPDLAYEWLGAEWHFAKPEHRELFRSDPISYAPQYGGMCADGVAYGMVTVNLDPEAFSIIDGKLYLNHDPGANQELREIPGQLAKADANWPEVRERFLGQ